uniref:Synaptopodin 2 like n=1 Tax=Tetraodon nigroviridis TaxID=99883 RepID=H3CLN0_TETNG
MVAEEIVITLSGGAPWGFRLQGGAEQQEPLQVRRRSKACRAGLKEYDQLVAIGPLCAQLSHAEAMSLIDTESASLSLKVKRAPPGFLSSPHAASASPLPPPAAPFSSRCVAIASPAAMPSGITSPPDSEAYYGETDSDADTQALTHRRQRRTPPHARSPRAPPDQVELMPTPREQAEAEGEGDSGFQEAGVCAGLACPPLVSPERAKEALMLGSSQQLVPMVGLQHSPVNDELSATYMDKARRAKLQRGESLVEKQVKEARTKCRSIASLLTDAPNPNSKGVLMFKKRRQRAKKYTLTCFGKAEGAPGGDSGGETGGETEEEGGGSIQSGSEVEEAGSWDPTWDAGYLDLLEKRSSACPPTTPTTPTTPTANHSFDHQSPGPEVWATQSSSLDPCSPQQPMDSQASPAAAALTNGASVAVSRASVVLSPPSRGPDSGPGPGPRPSPAPGSEPEYLSANFSPSPSVLNRTARPFTPGATPPRPTVTSVMFRPPQPKPAVAVSMVTIQPSHHAPDAKRAVSSASLYIPSRSPSVQPYITPPGALPSSPHVAVATASPLPPAAGDAVAARERRVAVPAARTGILNDARRRANRKPMFSAAQVQEVSPNPDLMSMVQNMDGRSGGAAAPEAAPAPCGEGGHESGPEEDWLRLGAEASNFLQAQRGPRPPPVAPKPHSPQAPPLGGKGGQLFARRQSRMDRYVVERAPSAAAAPARPDQAPSPTPSLPATWKYSSNIRAPPPISYNPLLSPSCPPQAQKKPQAASRRPQPLTPYGPSSSLLGYGSGDPHPRRGAGGAPQKTAPVCEIKRFSTPPPAPTGPALKVLAPRSATSLGERLCRSGVPSPPAPGPQPLQAHWRPGSTQSFRVPRPRFSTSNLGLQPSVWRPGSTLV